MNDIKKLNIAPTVGLLGLLKNMRYNEWHALAEFVDNSVQSYFKYKKHLKRINSNYKLQIKINILPNEIEIKDNAAGINSERYQAAFETGRPPPDTSGLSEFGVGMKIAACWFADKWSVHTKALGEDFYRLVEFDIKKIQEKQINELDVTSHKVHKDHSYTNVRLSKLNHKPRGLAIAKIKEQLSSMYRHLINNEEIEILLDNKKLVYEVPEIRKSGYYKDWEDGIIKDPPKIRWKKDFEFDFKYKPVRGFVAIRKKGSTKQEGFALFRRGRLIVNSFKPEEIFGQSNDRRQQVIFGEVHLDNLDVAFSKNDFIWSENEKSSFVSLLKKAIEFIDNKNEKSIINQARNWSENLERSDLRQKSKKGLSQVAKFVQKGIEQTSSQKIESKPLTLVHTPAKEREKQRFQVNFEGKSWNVEVNYEYDKNVNYFYDIQIANKKDEDIKIFINMKNTFIERFFSESIDGLGIFISYLAVSEVQVWKFDGIREVSLLRERLNTICKNIPPKN